MRQEGPAARVGVEAVEHARRRRVHVARHRDAPQHAAPGLEGPAARRDVEERRAQRPQVRREAHRLRLAVELGGGVGQGGLGQGVVDEGGGAHHVRRREVPVDGAEGGEVEQLVGARLGRRGIRQRCGAMPLAQRRAPNARKC